MGILIDLGSAKQVAAVQVMVSSGAEIGLRTGTSDPGAGKAGDNKIYDTFAPAGQPKTAGSGTTVLPGPGDPVRYLLVWISKLPPNADSSGGYAVQVQDIKVLVS